MADCKLLMEREMNVHSIKGYGIPVEVLVNE